MVRHDRRIILNVSDTIKITIRIVRCKRKLTLSKTLAPYNETFYCTQVNLVLNGTKFYVF
jgi:hypothetical protein